MPAPGDEDVVEGEEEEAEEEGDWAGGGVAEEAGWAGRLPKMASKSRFGGCVAPCSRGAGAGPSIRVPLAPPFFTCSHATPRHTHTDRQTDRQTDSQTDTNTHATIHASAAPSSAHHRSSHLLGRGQRNINIGSPLGIAGAQFIQDRFIFGTFRVARLDEAAVGSAKKRFFTQILVRAMLV